MKSILIVLAVLLMVGCNNNREMIPATEKQDVVCWHNGQVVVMIEDADKAYSVYNITHWRKGTQSGSYSGDCLTIDYMVPDQ